MNKPHLRDILLLLTVPNIGPGRVRQLFRSFASVNEMMNAPLRRLLQIEGIDQTLARRLKRETDQPQADEQLELMRRLDIRAVSIWEKGYPALLKKTAAAPVVLFYQGNLPESWPPAVGVVGTRQPSAYGRLACEKLVGGLVEQGLAVVSGLARGIDTTAHHATLQRGGKTYAVLGCGMDCIYPPENRSLHQRIRQEGAVLSEYFIGTGPDAVNFPRRNRIISGMCLGILVVEAGEKSGALITANYAAEQNREVFAVPGNITNPRSVGPHRLIQQGAKLVTRVEDILEEIAPQLTPAAKREKPLPAHLDELEKQLLTQLSEEPVHIDRLVLTLQESPARLLARLLTLELQGLVKQLAGKLFIRL